MPTHFAVRTVAKWFVAALTAAAEGGSGLKVPSADLEASTNHQQAIRFRRDLRRFITDFFATFERVVKRPGRTAVDDLLERVRVVGLNPRTFVGVEYPR